MAAAHHDLIFEERPVLLITTPEKSITDSDILSAFQQLPPQEKQQLLYLRDNGAPEFVSIETAFKLNSFMFNPQEHGLAIVLSRFNHSWIPNCKVFPYDVPGNHQLRAYTTRAIIPGEELTLCYYPFFQYLITKDRDQFVDFHCDCKACLVGTAFQQASDMRRALLRGLHYLTHGKDIDGPNLPSAGPVFNDPELKVAAEELRIPLSTRFIATVLEGFLLEEEGLMDRFMIRKMWNVIHRVGTSFKTRRNAQIAGIVMAQKSWLGMVCMAFRLYGKEDEADQEVAAELQGVRGRGSVIPTAGRWAVWRNRQNDRWKVPGLVVSFFHRRQVFMLGGNSLKSIAIGSLSPGQVLATILASDIVT